MTTSFTPTDLRTLFFDFVFGSEEGYICIAIGNPNVDKSHKDYFKERFFRWPVERNSVSEFIETNVYKANLWFGTSLLSHPTRKKQFCLPGALLWADLDTCHPDHVEPAPSIVTQTSPGRYQAFWRLEEPIEPYLQEEYSRRIAYKYEDYGADKTGWDLTQLLRIPHTHNFKYENLRPEIVVLRTFETRTPFEVLDTLLPVVPLNGDGANVPAEEMPPADELPDPEQIIYKYYVQLNRTLFNQLYSTTPTTDADWSSQIWRLLNICFEAGMTNEEVFAIGLTAECNKYVRDNRPPTHLWYDVLRAAAGQSRIAALIYGVPALLMPELVTADELADLPTTFIDDYYAWGTEATDAVPEYHELAAFMILSSVVAAGVKLDTSYGTLIPNLWGLVLGDSTLTRKTTAMRMAMDMLQEIDSGLILATDGSAEGLLTGLSTRPSRTSIFYKDEVSGFFDSINRKDYLAGMPETLTQLYDVPKVFTRLLRRETITISSPVFIFFGGGIRDKVYSLTTDEYVLSGFLPRFLVVSGHADVAAIRRTGPSVADLTNQRNDLQMRVTNLYERFSQTSTVSIGGQSIELPVSHKAELTEEAWKRYGDIEYKMVQVANDSQVPMLALPTFERLSRSLLKMAILLAAAAPPPKPPQAGNGNKVIVEESHVIKAASYIQRWGRYTVDLLLNTGKGMTERTLNKVVDVVEQNPNGILWSTLMTRFHWSSRDAKDILQTLEDRGQILFEKKGRGILVKAYHG